MLQYKSIDGQTIYDVCLMTYGDLNYLTKLITDNVNSYKVANPNSDTPIYSGQIFNWDNSIAVNANTNQYLYNNNINIATRDDI